MSRFIGSRITKRPDYSSRRPPSPGSKLATPTISPSHPYSGLTMSEVVIHLTKSIDDLTGQVQEIQKRLDHPSDLKKQLEELESRLEDVEAKAGW